MRPMPWGTSMQWAMASPALSLHRRMPYLRTSRSRDGKIRNRGFSSMLEVGRKSLDEALNHEEVVVERLPCCASTHHLVRPPSAGQAPRRRSGCCSGAGTPSGGVGGGGGGRRALEIVGELQHRIDLLRSLGATDAERAAIHHDMSHDECRNNETLGVNELTHVIER